MHQTICSVTVMDDSDPDIVFDEAGVCNHVHEARRRLREETFKGADGAARLEAIVAEIKANRGPSGYDCILGVSGGVDSTYLALLAKKLGLKPLAVHLDNGWNTDLAVSNIQRLLDHTGFDLVTHVVDWEEIRDLQRSMFASSVSNVEIVTDHAIFALLFSQASKHRIRYILSGSNLETESICPAAWSYDNRDARFLKAVHRQFGRVELSTYPFCRPVDFLFALLVRRVKLVKPLNYIDYKKAEVVQALVDEIGWRPYPRKHGESRFTRFFQEYYLPRKYGIDKRKMHYSSLIVSGQMQREEALQELNKPLYRADELEEDLEFVLKKLGYTRAEFDAIMKAAPKSASAYPNNAWLFDTRNPVVSMVRRLAMRS